MPSVLEALNSALHQAFAADPRVYLLGEDILDPYGGAFKVTRGLSTAFPNRVLATPISEAGIVGVAAGMALRGLRPVVEIMFGDFITLAADQIINHLSKFRWMYHDQVRVPMVIRTPMGGRRGYGPTHSQTLEKHLLGTPGLRVLAPASLGDPGGLLRDAILHSEDPLLFVENKLLYLTTVQTKDTLAEFTTQVSEQQSSLGMPPCYAHTLTIQGAPAPELTITAYGYMAELSRQAMLKLAYEHELFCALVVPTQLAPYAIDPILESARQTRRLLVVEEGGITLGWGAEVLAQAAEKPALRLNAARRLAGQDLPIPASRPLESMVLPGVDEIITAALAAAHS
ncbi:MAG: hypothetical protein JW726_06130 [Anaerolineales bacterium]|nr:hypothetical protein [Anaerolineales bacterium]